MEIVHVGGAKGVGKSSVLRELRKDLKAQDTRIEVLSASREYDKLSRTIYEKPLVDLTTQEILAIQKTFMQNVKDMPYNIIVLDSHYVDMSANGAIPLLQRSIWPDFACHIVIETDPEVVLHRRILDQTRKRQLDIATIAVEIEAERTEAQAISRETGKRTYILRTLDTLDESKEAIKDILRKEFRIKL
jgi:adenylate kinase